MVVTFSGVFGFYQESSSEKIMDSFKKMIPSYAIVIRDGIEYTIPSEEVVVGDLVEVQAGGTVPADIRVIDSSSLKVTSLCIYPNFQLLYDVIFRWIIVR